MTENAPFLSDETNYTDFWLCSNLTQFKVMASKKLYDVFSDNFLTCHICLHEYEDPRVLPCYHTFCLACLAQHVAASGSGGNIKCPVCLQEAPVPPGGIEKLVRNFFLSKVKDFMLTTENKDKMCGNCDSQVAQFYCQDCRHFLCENCRQKQHDAIKILRGHKIISASDHDKQVQEEMDARLFCDKHKGQQLIFYCTDDDVVVCRDCILTKHNKHNCVDIADVAKIHKEKINSAFNHLSKNIALFEKAESEISKQQKYTTDVVNKTVTDIQQQEADIIKEVQRISAQLIAEAKDHAATHMKSLEAEKDRVQLQKVSIHSTCEFAKQLVQHGSHTEVMTHAKNIQARMKELNNVRPTVQVKTIEITFSKGKLPADFFGRVTMLEWIDEFESSMKNVWDISCSQSGTIYLVSVISCKLTAISPSHEVIFQVDVPSPRGVTVLSDDRLVVTCRDGCRVYSSSGKHVKTFGQGDMSYPQGVTLDNNGHILVCDMNNKCICGYDAVQYNLINKIGIPMCNNPRYIAVLPCRDTIVVSDSDGHCVYGVTPQGDVVFQYGTPGEEGSGDGYLNYPWGVCTDSVGHIFIADQWNHRVVVLTSDGQLLRYVVGPEQVSAPAGVAIDIKGQLVVGMYGGKVKTFRYVY
ncbi:tripartite motif-containing protein 2-like [Lingula anatina]|uniref:Tripartite motif-containing protein 2-like n=1 Tax=Lingula anatina TaxID=7574 RepID=A0A1S3HYV9_LINAN|nr:tripartite motif-containing protein 2-like [Lingula anatina]|eukprot:XP_013390269.1 tripartite motif-containing protein 2-like [Lingula anatina]